MTDHPDHIDSNTLNPASTSGASGSSLRDDAAKLSGTAADKLASAADSRKGSVVEPVREVSGALNAAADRLADTNGATPTWLADGVRSLASGIGDFAQRIEQGDSRQLLSEVERFARQRPVLFLAGCAAVGFAAARVLRAGAPASTSTDASGGTGSFADDAGSAGGMPGTGQTGAAGSSGAATYTPPLGHEPLPTPAMGAGSL